MDAAWRQFQKHFNVEDLTTTERVRLQEAVEDVYGLGHSTGRKAGFAEAYVNGRTSDT